MTDRRVIQCPPAAPCARCTRLVVAGEAHRCTPPPKPWPWQYPIRHGADGTNPDHQRAFDELLRRAEEYYT